MTGPILNAFGIIIGGLLGLTKKGNLSPENQNLFRVLIGAATVYFGLRLTWISLSGSFLQITKQMAIVIVSMMLGRQLGKWLHLQHTSNLLGQFARKQIEAPGTKNANQGFLICSILFAVAPLAIL